MSTVAVVDRIGPSGGGPGSLEMVTTVAGFGDRLETARACGLTVGLVPTMGALHDGHRSLVERAAGECDLVAVSVFVNPLQFGRPEDLERYPRTLDADRAVVSRAGGRILFAPALSEMYPELPAPVHTSVAVSGVSERWEGASRPGHFDGVSTVVAKLFAAAGRCRAYFGEKDFQQLAVVRTMARDLSFPVEVVACPTVRDGDGLALSSRNVRLSRRERRAALVLPRALLAGADAVSAGTSGVAAIEAGMARVVAGQPGVDLDYAVLVDAADLTPAPSTSTDRPLRLLIAAQVGPVRLIDNLDPRQADLSTQLSVTKGTN